MNNRIRNKWNRRLSFLLALLLLLGDNSLQYAMAAESVSAGDPVVITEAVSDSDVANEGTESGKTDAVSDGDATDTGSVSGEAGSAGTETLPNEAGEHTVSGSDLVSDTVSGSDLVSDTVSNNDLTQETISDGDLVSDTVSGSDLASDTVSGSDLMSDTVSGNVPVRQPEDFYEEAEPENYGTLAAYDEYSRTYHVAGNQYVTVIGYDGSTYLDEDGNLQVVDNTLVENPASTFATFGSDTSYVNSANDYMALLNGSVDGGDLLTLASGDYLLSMTPVEGSFQDGVVKDNAIRYNNVLPDVDYQYTILGNSVKEDIILLKPQSVNSFSYKLNTYGLSVELLHNTLFLYEEGTDPEADAIFVLEAPEMTDAAGELSFGVKLDLEEAEEGVLVTVTADSSWLNDEARVYPVRIDPTAIQVNRSAIHIACAEEGSPNSVIGDNSYPYVGYDDGITSGNLAGFNSKHRNCRSYFAIDYDFSSLATEPEIVSAAFQVTQKTRWSKGTSEFGLYGVEEAWQVGSLTWNSQIGYTHYFLDSQRASTTSGEALTFDVTEEVSAWINGTSPNHGLVMKALIEAPNEDTGDLGVSMQCEVFYNNSSASYAPKLIVSWTGDLTDLSALTLDDTTIDIYPVVERNGDKSTNTRGVVAHGLAKPGSTVHYSLVNGTTGETEAETSLVYPDSARYQGAYPNALDYNRRLSNWQSEVFAGLTPGQVYYVEAYAEGVANDLTIPGAVPEYGVGATVRSDSFLIYEESAFDLIPRIAQHYGVDVNTILADMKMQDCLTKEGNLIFIRNPQNTDSYSSGELSEYYKAIIDGLLLGRAENCEFGYEPININTGNFYMEQTDASLTDIGGDFTLSRQYNSKGAAYKGSLGYGWTFAYDERMGELGDGSIIWMQNNGNIVTFTPDGEGYQAPAGCDYTLTEEADGYTVTDFSDGSSREFDSFGLLKAVVDRYGNRTTLTYDMDFYLQKITSPSGKVFNVALDDAERISSVTLPDGYGVTYTYDDAGNLASVKNPAGDVIRFEYDASHYMTAWYDENGHRVVANEYDSEGRVTEQTDAEGGVVTLVYEASEDGKGGRTIATDAEGNVTVYSYDEKYRTTGIVYPDGTSESRSYNDAGYLAESTDRMGVTTSYTYDSKGNVLTEKRQDGAARTYTYDDNSQVTSVTDYDGGVTVYTYDGQNRLTAVTDAEGNTISYAYDDSNRLTAVTDANGGITGYVYDGACVTSMTDAEGNVWHYTYDAMNRLLTMTDPKGQTTSNTYDILGRVIAETDAAGESTLYTFDKAGAVTAITDKEGYKSSFTYDRMNRILSGVDPLGNTLHYTYDENGNKLTETDAEGQTLTYTYDAMNRIAEVMDAEGQKQTYAYNGMDQVTAVTDRRGYAVTYSYDPVKQVVTSETDKEGNTTTYETDACGRITKIIYADGSSISYTWNHLSQLTESTDQLGKTTVYTYDGNGNVIRIQETADAEAASREYRYVYDALNRLVQTIDPLGNEVNYTYDAVGNLLTVTDGRGSTTTYEYDALSRLTKVLDALGGSTGYTYDKEGRVLTVTAPQGDTQENAYDAIGQLIAQTDAGGNVTRYAYDTVSRLTAVTDALEGVTAYTYDRNGSLTGTTDAMGNAHTYAVDAEGNLLEDTYPNGETEKYSYDRNGNVKTYTDRYGIVTTFTVDAMGRIVKAADTAGNEMTYTYDPAGNLLTQTDVLGRTATYTYDTFGRPVAVTDIDGVTTGYEYDALDRLVKITDGEGKVTTYAYDEAGNLIHTTEPGEADYTYAYDALNRLTQKIDPVGATTTFVYDKNSNLTQVEDGNGVITGYAYDALNRLTTYNDGNGGETGYTYDALSRLTAITTPEGLQEQYGYDAVGNLLTVTDGLGQTYTYTYDKLYRLVQSTSPMGAVEKYTYDKHDVVTSVTDALGNVTLYEVDANGQVTKKRQANGGSYLYTYDAVQRLTGITTPLGYESIFTYSVGNDIVSWQDSLGRTTTYEYDIMHRMTSMTDPEGGVTIYDYDTRGNQSQVTNALGYSWSYTYDKVDRMTTVTDPEEKVTSVVYDMVGNVTAITTPGERTTSYAYDNNYNTTAITDPMGYVYGSSYDSDDRLIGTTDPLQQTTGYTYDAVNRITAYVDKMGLTESYRYDAHGNVLEKTATDGLITKYTYDLKDRLTSVTDPMGSTAYYTYDVMDNLTGITDYMGRGTTYTYDLEGNLTSITDAAGRREIMTYDAASRITSYTSNGGNRITYDYDKLDNMVEKSYNNACGKENAEPVAYAYDTLGQRVEMQDSTGDTQYTYDGLGRITSVTTYRVPEKEKPAKKGTADKDSVDKEFSHEEEHADTVAYTYDGADNLAAITYPDGTQVLYEYDKNDNLIKVTDRKGEVTTYEYDALNRVTAMHRPNGISTYNTYNARDQIVELVNKYDCNNRIISKYSYTYDDRGYIVGEQSLETTWYNECRHGYGCGDGKHWGSSYDNNYGYGNGYGQGNNVHGNSYGNSYRQGNYNGYSYISNSYNQGNYSTNSYSYNGNNSSYRSSAKSSNGNATKTSSINTTQYGYTGNNSNNNQYGNNSKYDGNYSCNHKHTCHVNICYKPYQTRTIRTFTYDDAGKLIGSTEQVNNKGTITYEYGYDLMGNRTKEVTKDACGRITESIEHSYNDSNQLVETVTRQGCYTGKTRYVYDKDGNLICEYTPVCGRWYGHHDLSAERKVYKYGVENRLEAVYEGGQLLMASAYDGDGNRVFQLNYNPDADWDFDWHGIYCDDRDDCDHDKDDYGNDKVDSSSGNDKNKDNNRGDSGKDSGSKNKSSSSSVNNGRSNNKSNSGNSSNAKKNNNQNECGVLFPINDKATDTKHGMLERFHCTGKEADYELIEYINDVNREYTEVLVEQNIFGKTTTTYTYGVDRLSLEKYNCKRTTGYYLYDPRGSVTGITNERGYLYQSYRYNVNGELTFGGSEYDNQYTYNGESYNPNIECQYLRARYYNVVTASFLTEDSYLGDITEPLTLNRYNYCVSSYLNHIDPSGHRELDIPYEEIQNAETMKEVYELVSHYMLLEWDEIEGEHEAREQQVIENMHEFHNTTGMQAFIEIESTIGVTGIYNWLVSPLRYSYQGEEHPFVETMLNRQENTEDMITGFGTFLFDVTDPITHPEVITGRIYGTLFSVVDNPDLLFPDLFGKALDAWDAAWESDDETFFSKSGYVAMEIGVALGAAKLKKCFDTKVVSKGGTYTNLDDGLNFSNKALEHMGESGRQVPMQTLQDAIRYGEAMPDPRGSSATMYYTTMYKNGKMYNLEVLYDEATNTVYHFEYARKAMGNLPAISK